MFFSMKSTADFTIRRFSSNIYYFVRVSLLFSGIYTWFLNLNCLCFFSHLIQFFVNVFCSSSLTLPCSRSMVREVYSKCSNWSCWKYFCIQKLWRALFFFCISTKALQTFRLESNCFRLYFSSLSSQEIFSFSFMLFMATENNRICLKRDEEKWIESTWKMFYCLRNP